jgi:2,3-bisphosphoglycerate-independent phosphoglycerate mutase
MKKVVFLLFDGLADLPINGNTPLKIAKKPNLDYLAKNGLTGELTVLPNSFWKGKLQGSISHFANVALLGFNPNKYPLQRGPLEAVGTGIPYQDGFLAVRCNLASVDEDFKVLDRRAGRSTYGLDEIVRYINEHVDIGVPFTFLRIYGHRCVLILKERMSEKVTTNDPFKEGERVKPIEALSTEAEKTAILLNKFADRVYDLAQYHPKNYERKKKGLLPANYVLLREAGNQLLDLPDFPKKWKLGKAVCLAENGAVKATCMLADFNSVTIPEQPLRESLEFIFDNVEELLIEYPLVYVHIKWTDLPGHDGDFKGKVKIIEAIDKYLEVFKKFDGIVIVTTDHITSCEKKDHMPGKVPLLIYGKAKDSVDRFDEFSVRKGKLKNYIPIKLWKYVLK